MQMISVYYGSNDSRPARGGTAQRKILHLANWSQLIHPGPASSMTKFFFGVESIMRVNAASLDIRDSTTSTPGTLNDLTTDLIMANNNNISLLCHTFSGIQKMLQICEEYAFNYKINL